MDTECAPLLANLFLFFYENKCIKSQLKLSQKVAVRFKYTLRYYYRRLITLNNLYFEQEIPNIYPPQLVLKKTTAATNRLSYLDMCIHLEGRRFSTSVYDKFISIIILI